MKYVLLIFVFICSVFTTKAQKRKIVYGIIVRQGTILKAGV